MSPPILHPHLSLSITRATCATGAATQQTVNGDKPFCSSGVYYSAGSWPSQLRTELVHRPGG
jgi:hypothetical protein